jgi:bifunctional non-homologous end joining protein LigD
MAKGAYYVSPTLVCDVSFTEWTGDERIRHPAFLGLLEDVKPKSVTRQRD